MRKQPRKRAPVRLVVDMCVWLDLIADPCAATLISAVETLVTGEDITLVVRRGILNEFVQDRAQVIEDRGRSISSIRKRAEPLEGIHDPRRRRTVRNELSETDHRFVNLADQAVHIIERIETLLAKAEVHDITDAIKVRAFDRGAERRAPLHRPRNALNDALLVELYADMITKATVGQTFVLVTHNAKDFSHPTISKKLPHPDLMHLFSRRQSRYFITLGEALRSIFPQKFLDLVIEQEWLDQPRRKIAEVVTAEHELFERAWYNCHRLRREKVDRGKIEIVENEAIPVKRFGSTMQRSMWDAALRAAQNIEDRYGFEALGPWSDFEWGMINGKLSALSWTLGDEWDTLT
jgi:hypothetical protein